MLQMNAENLPLSEAFLYLGQKITYINIYWTALYLNLCKAQRRWGMIAKVMERTVAAVRAQGAM